LRFGWRIEGRAPFRPLRVFDDGRRTYVDFPPAVARGGLPPLLVPAADGGVEAARVRVRGTRMVVEGVFPAAELRLGSGRRAARVRLVRDPRP
ncbi:TrbG/VirB9 family P-type conjugative transfer protein, partial [Phenylobacterium sp.]|uniref:TrbG/VirB9 family P-type conjugative transfer protein n=1 Tax=Phenylobacterium sp. TaxID=1871053 RepID=UPI002FE312E7